MVRIPLIVGTPKSALSAVERCQCATTVQLAHLILVFFLCLDMILNFKLLLYKMLQSGLSTDMFYINKSLSTFDVSLGKATSIFL